MFIARADATETARAAYHRATDGEESSMIMLWYQTILRLLGDEAGVLDACPMLAERFAHLPEWMLDWYQYLLDFHCNEISAAELLVKAGTSRMHQCEAYFLIGVQSLAQGNRVNASKQFQPVIDTRVFNYWDWEWNRMFLKKLEQDPTWPPWIPMQ